jgi:hypothetical protein
VNYAARIKDALDNSESYIDYFSHLADSKLEKKIMNIQEQMRLAATDKNDGALRLLTIWERQIIEARLLKYDQHPQLDELSEIEKAVAEMEAFDEIIEKRNKVLLQKLPEQKPIAADLDEKPAVEVTQMKLF